MSDKYTSQRINPEILSTLDVASEGKVVSAETWNKLWSLVIQRINTVDSFCIGIQDIIQTWKESEATLSEALKVLQEQYLALEQNFVHYGSEAPVNPNVRFWIEEVPFNELQQFVTYTEMYKALNTEINGSYEYIDNVITEDIKNANKLVSNALKGTLNGEVVAIKDVSPLEHEVKVKTSFDKIIFENGSTTTYKAVDLVAIPEYTPLNHSADEFNPNSGWESVVLNQKGFNAYISISGVSAGAILTNGTSYYTLKLVDSPSGTVSCVIDGTKVYLQVDDGEVTTYDVPENTKIHCISCYGEGFDGAKLDVATSRILKPSDVTLTVGGKNLFNVSEMAASGNCSASTTFNGDEITTNFVSGALVVNSSKNVVYKAGEYTATLIPITENASMCFLAYPLSTPKETKDYKYMGASTGVYTYTFTATEDFYFCVGDPGIAHRGLFTYKIQLEPGSTPTEYEPYKTPVTYTADANGEINIPSQYPSMTIIPDTEVELSVEYNRDINKAFQELQQVVAQLQTLAVATVPMTEEVNYD